MKHTIPFSLLTIVLLSSCATTHTFNKGIDTESLLDTRMRFVIEDNPNALYHRNNGGSTLSLDFFLDSFGNYFNEKNLKTINIHTKWIDSSPGWFIAPQFIATGIGGANGLADYSIGPEGTALSTGPYTFDFILTDGRKMRKTVDLAPMVLGHEGAGHIYANAYEEEKSGDFIDTIERPSVDAVLDEAANLRVEFSVEDTRIVELDISLFSKEGNQLGYFSKLYDKIAGILSPWVNAGTGFFADGKKNSVLIPMLNNPFPIPASADIDSISVTVIGEISDTLELRTMSEIVKVGH